MALPSPKSLARLRQSWLCFVLLSLLSLGTGWFFLAESWGGAFAWRWLAPASLGLIYLSRVLWLGLESNRRPGESELLPHLGAANILTLLRGVLISFLAGFLFLPPLPGEAGWIPGVIYILAIAADYLDGYLARISNQATRLGEILDMSFDGLGVLVAALLAVQYGQVPGWYLGVALARYVFLAGIWVRRRLDLEIHELPHSPTRRALAGVQMGFLAAALLPIFPASSAHLAAFFFAAPFLAGFFKDWLLTIGRLPAARPSLRSAWERLARWLPVPLRVLAPAFFLLSLVSTPIHQVSPGALPRSGFFSSDSSTAVLLLGIHLLVLLLIALGAAGRLAALLGLILAGLNHFQSLFSPGQAALIAVYSLLFFLGTGPYSIWTPETWLMAHRAGETKTAAAGEP